MPDRFAIPHQFQPALSARGAAIAVLGTLTQILFGSLLAALWGVGIWSTAASDHSLVFKIPVIVFDVAGLALSLYGLIKGVNRATAKLDKHQA